MEELSSYVPYLIVDADLSKDTVCNMVLDGYPYDDGCPPYCPYYQYCSKLVEEL